MKRTLVFLFTFLVSIQLIAQGSGEDKTSFGLGAGLDYGGFGGNILFFPQENIGLFAGAGYAFIGIGGNIGLKLRTVPDDPSSRFAFFGLAMYGYNTALIVKNSSNLNSFFYGPSIGVGVDFKFNKEKKSYTSVALLLPIRGSKVDDYCKEKNISVSYLSGSLYSPILISFGYRFVMN